MEYEHADVDSSIIELLNKGVCDKAAFARDLDYLDHQFKRHELSIKLNNAWSHFNGNFQADSEQVLKAFSELLDEDSGYLAAHDYKQCISIIEKLGGVIKPQWQDDFVAGNIGDADLKKLSELEKQTINPDVLRQIQVRRQDLQKEMTIYGTIKSVIDRQGWNPDMVEFLAEQPISAYQKEFADSTDKELLHNLYSFGKMWGNAKDAERGVAQKIAAALEMISFDSELNKMRVQWILDQIRPATFSPPA